MEVSGRWTLRTYAARALTGVLAVAAVVSVASGMRHAWTVGANDFQWSGAHLLGRGVDAYQVVIGGHLSQIALTQYPNYAPLLYVVLLPFGLLDLQAVTPVYSTATVLGLLGAAVLVGRTVGLRAWGLVAFLGLFGLAFPTWVVLASGQQAGPTLVVAVLGLWATRERWAGSALAVAVAKYSFAPLMLVPLLRRQWVTLAIVAGAHAAALVVFCMATGSSPVRTLVAPLHVASQTQARGAGDVITLSRLLGAPGALGMLLGAGALVLLGWFARSVLAEGDWVECLGVTSLISLVVFPHLYYDYCFLLPVLGCAVRRRGAARTLLLAVVLLCWYVVQIPGLWPYEYQVSGVTVTGLALLGALVVLVRVPVVAPADAVPAGERGRAAPRSAALPTAVGP